MEKAQVLVRQVVRAFYKTDHVVVIDALVNHIALNVENLRVIFVSTGRNKTDLLKLIGKLREGGLISMLSRLETKAGAQKPTTVEYFYIDYRRAIDATKYRLHILENTLRGKARPDQARKELVCPQCNSEWTFLEVMDNPDLGPNRGSGFSGFLCHRCQSPLKHVEIDPEAAESNGPLGIFNDQFGWLINLLKEIDNTTIPETTGESALEDAVPVPVDKAPLTNGGYESAPTAVMPTAVRGMVTGPEKVEISITTNSEVTAAQQAAAAEQKERLAAQNQLPEWHTRSTVTNEMTAAGQREEVARQEREAEAGKLMADSGEDQKTAAESSLDDIFAQLENDARTKTAQEDEEDEEEEDEEEFEDAMDVEGPSEPKRIKIEETNGTGVSSGNGTPVPATLEEDSDAEEFEDV